MAGRVKIDDRVWRKIKKEALKNRNAHVRVGILADEGGTADHDGISVLELAAIHEFGSPAAGIPERSFIRSTFTEKRDKVKRFMQRIAKQIILQKISWQQALNLIGLKASTEVKKTITQGEGVPPPLKPATIARKGSSRPLVDTGQLLNSITWKVKRR